MEFNNMPTTARVIMGGIIGALAVVVGMLISQTWEVTTMTTAVSVMLPAVVGAFISYLAGLNTPGQPERTI